MVQRFEIERTPMAVMSALGRAFLEDKKGMVFSCAISPSGTDFPTTIRDSAVFSERRGRMFPTMQRKYAIRLSKGRIFSRNF